MAITRTKGKKVAQTQPQSARNSRSPMPPGLSDAKEENLPSQSQPLASMKSRTFKTQYMHEKLFQIRSSKSKLRKPVDLEQVRQPMNQPNTKSGVLSSMMESNSALRGAAEPMMAKMAVSTYADKIGPGSIVSPKNRQVISQSRERESAIRRMQESARGPLRLQNPQLEDAVAALATEQAETESTGFRLKLQASSPQKVEQKTTTNQSQKHKRNIQNLAKLAAKAKELSAGFDEDNEITKYQDHPAPFKPLLPLDGARRASRNISRNAGTVPHLPEQLRLSTQGQDGMKSTFSPDIDEYLPAPDAEEYQPASAIKSAIGNGLISQSRIGLQQPTRPTKEVKKALKATTSVYGQAQEQKSRELAPLKRIEALKKQADGLTKDNDEYRDMIEVLDTKHRAVQSTIVELNNKKVQARYDMLEIKRDLATSEVNFSAYRGVRSRLERVVGAVRESNAKLNNLLALASSKEDGALGAVGRRRGSHTAAADQELNGWNSRAAPGASRDSNGQLSDAQIAQILASLQQIQEGQQSGPPAAAAAASPDPLYPTSSLQWLRSSQDGGGSPSPSRGCSSPLPSPVDHGPSDPYPTGCESVPLRQSRVSGHQPEDSTSMTKPMLRKSRQSIKGTRRDPKKDGEFRRGNHAMLDDSPGNQRNRRKDNTDELSRRVVVSGVNCHLKVKNLNGQIKGCLTCEISCKNFKIDMAPSASKKNVIDLKCEIERLKFQMAREEKKNKNFKQQLSLFYDKPSADHQVTDGCRATSQLIRLTGSQSKFTNVEFDVSAYQGYEQLGRHHKEHVINKLGKEGCSVSLLMKDQRITSNLKSKEFEVFLQSQLQTISAQGDDGQQATTNNCQADNDDGKSNCLCIKCLLPALLGQYVQKYMTVIQKQPAAGRPSWKFEQYKLMSIQEAQRQYQSSSQARTPIRLGRATKKGNFPRAQAPLQGPARTAYAPAGDATGRSGSCVVEAGSKALTAPQNPSGRQEDLHQGEQPTEAGQHGVPRQSATIAVAYKFSFAGPGADQLLKGLTATATSPETDAGPYSLAMGLPTQPEQKRRRSHHFDSPRKELLISTAADMDAKSAAPQDRWTQRKQMSSPRQRKLQHQTKIGQSISPVNQQSRARYIQDLQLVALRYQHEGTSDRAADDEKEMGKYEMLYAMRLAKSAKRFAGWRVQQEKAQELRAQRKEDQIGMTSDFFGSVEQKVVMKSRAADRGHATKKKYYRQPKIYQNNYVAGLRQQGVVLLQEQIEDAAYPGFLVLYLIFREQNSTFLLLGRKQAAETRSGSAESSSSAAAVEKGGSDDHSEDEKDDDSPYFVKITLDQKFLNYLGVAEALTVSELQELCAEQTEGRSGRICHRLYENTAFKEIIHWELDLKFPTMFGIEKSKPSRLPSATGQGSLAQTQSPQRKSSPAESPTPQSPKSLIKDLISIEEEAEAAAQAESGDQTGTLGSHSTSQHGDYATSPFATRLKGMIKNFSMILNFKQGNKGF